MMKKLLVLLAVLGVATVFSYYKAIEFINKQQPVENEIIFQIKKGASIADIADVLQQSKLIEEKWQFILYAKINKLYPKVKAGEYLIDKDVSLVDLGKILSDGKFFHRRVTIPEGLTAVEIMKIFADNEFLSGDMEELKEGEILPETYTFSRGDNKQGIIEQARKALEKVLEDAWNNRDTTIPLKTKEELLILASIIEKETGVSEERAQIASVFVNRLKKGMLLQTDPTVIYAITEGKRELERPLYRRDLEFDSPYNTYKYAGLPPTPICSPGKEAIWAAAHPDSTPYLYFVASGTGGHNFAKTLSEHNENVRKWKSLVK